MQRAGLDSRLYSPFCRCQQIGGKHVTGCPRKNAHKHGTPPRVLRGSPLHARVSIHAAAALLIVYSDD